MIRSIWLGAWIAALGGGFIAPFEAQAHAQARSVHVPSEQEQNARRAEAAEHEIRTYQRDSVESFGTQSLGGMAFLKYKLAQFHLTLAQFLLGLGSLGFLFTWNKNKRKVPWAVLSVFSVVLLLLGLGGIVFRWPQLN